MKMRDVENLPVGPGHMQLLVQQIEVLKGKVEALERRPSVLRGSGTPEGAIVAPVGSIYQRTNGGAGTSIYVKESGASSTGWVAK